MTECELSTRIANSPRDGIIRGIVVGKNREITPHLSKRGSPVIVALILIELNVSKSKLIDEVRTGGESIAENEVPYHREAVSGNVARGELGIEGYSDSTEVQERSCESAVIVERPGEAVPLTNIVVCLPHPLVV